MSGRRVKLRHPHDKRLVNICGTCVLEMQQRWLAARKSKSLYHEVANQAREALLRIRGGKMAWHSGGDSAMIFDSYDAEVERERKGWWSVDESAFAGFDAALAALDDALKEEK